MNALHDRPMSGPEKEHGMSEEAPAIVGIAALTIDCTDPLGLAHWWRRVLGGAVEGHPKAMRPCTPRKAWRSMSYRCLSRKRASRAKVSPKPWD